MIVVHYTEWTSGHTQRPDDLLSNLRLKSSVPVRYLLLRLILCRRLQAK